jgi:hypothetical protein
MNNFPHLRRISQAKWIVVGGLILLWTLNGAWLILNCQELGGKSADQLLKQVVEGGPWVNAQATMDG